MKTIEEVKKPKTKKVLKIAILVLLSLILLFGVTIIWFMNNGIEGLFKESGIPKILGLNKQVQLEQSQESVDIKEVITEKLGYSIESYSREDLKNKKTITIQLDSDEAAYLITKMQKEEDTIKNIQVKIDKEDNLILSAVLNVDSTIEAFGANKTEIEESVGDLPQEVPLYTEIYLDNENKASLINDIKIGKISVPKIAYSPVNEYLDEGIEDFFDEVLGIDLEHINISGGILTLEGKFPSP